MNAYEIVILIEIYLILYVTYAILTYFKTVVPRLDDLLVLIEILLEDFFAG